LGDALSELLDAAVDRQDLPFAIAMVANRAGVLWETAVGDARPGTPARLDTMFRLWSATKAIGAGCPLILLDRGLLSMDTAVAEVLPEFIEVGVLVSANGKSARPRPPRRECTLSHLLTHTCGFRYGTQGPGGSITSGMFASFFYPMTFAPGEDFAYGIGVDHDGGRARRRCRSSRAGRGSPPGRTRSIERPSMRCTINAALPSRGRGPRTGASSKTTAGGRPSTPRRMEWAGACTAARPTPSAT
jgi:hypothetical protein